jgi:DNA-binding protein HU-beta
MHKTELVALLQEKTGKSPEEVRKTVNAMIDILTESLAEGDKILLPGVGSLKVVDKSEQKGRNPQTGEEITIPASKRVKFSPGKILRETVKSLDFITKNV